MNNPYPEEHGRFDAPDPSSQASEIDKFAEEARRAIGRWYCPRRLFAAPRDPEQSFVDWIKEHWRRFPATSPDGGKIIEHEALPPVVGFDE